MNYSTANCEHGWTQAIYNNKTLPESDIKKLCDEKNEIYRSFLTELAPKGILPNIESLLKQLKEKNIKICLASASQMPGRFFPTSS